MKIFLVIISLVFLSFLAAELYSFSARQHSLKSDFQEAKTRLEKLKTDQASLEAELEYLSNPLNLSKEMRSRFNLKKPGENMIIIVPQTTSSGGNN